MTFSSFADSILPAACSIIDASSFYGKGYWLLDVQAHSLQEGGQLLLMKVDGS